jgi:hypothetical protein
VENGAPFINFSYALENGNNIQTSIMTKGDKVITLTIGEDGSPATVLVKKSRHEKCFFGKVFFCGRHVNLFS